MVDYCCHRILGSPGIRLLSGLRMGFGERSDTQDFLGELQK